MEKELTEWVKAYKDVAERHALAETPQESADYLISLIVKRIEGIENPYEKFNLNTDMEIGKKFGFNEAIQKVIEEMRK